MLGRLSWQLLLLVIYSASERPEQTTWRAVALAHLGSDYKVQLPNDNMLRKIWSQGGGGEVSRVWIEEEKNILYFLVNAAVYFSLDW